MNLIEWVKGVISKMLGRETLQQALKITPTVSDIMKSRIELWEAMYTDCAPWLAEDDMFSLHLPQLIASEKARMATLEMEVKITGEGARPDFIRDTFKQVECKIRDQLEYGIALGGLVIKPYIVMGPDKKYKIKFTYTKACDFYPLSFSADGELTSAAFVDRIITADKTYSKLEVHVLQGNKVLISNKAFVSDRQISHQINNNMLGNEIALSSIPEWAEIEPEVILENVDTLLFAYYRNPGANIIDIDSPLGISGFARATSLIKDADEQYSTLKWEFKGSELAVDIDRTALNPTLDKTGRPIEELPKHQKRLYRHNLDLQDNEYNVFSPAIRDASIINGLNNILMHIEDVCSLSRGTISEVNVTEARTATELKILKQRAYSANADIQHELQDCFEELFHILDIYCDMYDIVPAGKFEVAYKWDDSIIVDKDSERQIDIIDINTGLMSRVEYRMKWFGETENQAEESLQKIMDETQAKLEMQQEAMMGVSAQGNLEGEKPEDPKTEKQEDLDKQNRAKESNEHTTSKEK